MTCYIKHRRVINNTFVPYVLDFLNQKTNYVIRHPFKESEEVGLDLINNWARINMFLREFVVELTNY